MKTFKLLFRGSEHNFSAQNFHNLCDNKGATISIVKSEYEQIFGLYTDINWNKE